MNTQKIYKKIQMQCLLTMEKKRFVFLESLYYKDKNKIKQEKYTSLKQQIYKKYQNKSKILLKFT